MKALTNVARTILLDLQWRQAVCKHLSTRLNREVVVANIYSRLLPVLQALYPLDQVALPYAGLMPILDGLASLHMDLKTGIDI